MQLTKRRYLTLAEKRRRAERRRARAIADLGAHVFAIVLLIGFLLLFYTVSVLGFAAT